VYTVNQKGYKTAEIDLYSPYTTSTAQLLDLH